MITIDANKDLAQFRSGLTGRYGVGLVQQHRRVLVQLPVGVGKSTWLDEITFEASGQKAFDLVVVLSPTRQLIAERKPLQNPPSDVRVVNIRRRPSQDCGQQRGERWRQYEKSGMSTLGRVEICGQCPRRGSCFWPKQYGEGLKGTGLVYATQTHLERSPRFIPYLKRMTGAKSCLVLMDESNFIAKPVEQIIQYDDLRRFAEVLRSVKVPQYQKLHARWVEMVELLLQTQTTDLQVNWYHDIPAMPLDWVLAVQRAGWRAHGEVFRFLGYDLKAFAQSDVETRLRGAAGEICFSSRPQLGEHCMVFSGTTSPRFAEYRYAQPFATPFSDYRFIHPDTRWYNLASSLGTKRHFPANKPQVLDFFAGLIARRLEEGKRPLLVCKKAFVPECAEYLGQRLSELGCGNVQLLTSGFTPATLSGPAVIPIIHYGVIGINLFEGFDAAYCLTGYYVNEHVVNQCLQDVVRPDLRLEIEIRTEGAPKRRVAQATYAKDRIYNVHEVAPLALQHQELEPVLQAVGRVRPFTRPREIITFQCGQLPGVEYTNEFGTLAEARVFFGVSSRQQHKTRKTLGQVAALRSQGLTQSQVARRLGVSERTVRRHEPDKPPI
jgi:hypothetical protein